MRRARLDALSAEPRSVDDRFEDLIMAETSDRIAAAVATLPIVLGMRVLEIGCRPGVVARLVPERTGACDPAQAFVDGGDPLRELGL